MKKYLYIYKFEIMSNLQYVLNILVGFITLFLFLFIFFQLWNYMYDDTSEIITGYSKDQMIWYVTITELLWNILKGRKLCKKISYDVRTGNITYNINKPYNYILYALSSHLGDATVNAFIYVILGMITGFVFLRHFPTLNIFSVILVLLSAVLAIIVNSLFSISIGLFSFIIEDSSPFYWVYSKLILVFGTLFPIEYFPKFISLMLTYSPIYAVSYGPAKLFVDFSFSKFINIFIIQIIYLLIAYLLCIYIYKKGVKRLNVNGG